MTYFLMTVTFLALVATALMAQDDDASVFSFSRFMLMFVTIGAFIGLPLLAFRLAATF